MHEQQIMEMAIQHWNAEFTGVSALSLAKRLGIEHEVVVQVLREFTGRGLGSINDRIPVHSSTSEDENIPIETTVIFFPARELLTDYFYASGLANRGLPEYTARLHMGYSQTRHFYFEQQALSKYLSHPELYRVSDSVEGGAIRMNAEGRILELVEKEQDRIRISNFRFGKRLLTDGRIAISAILWDLSELPESEQRYWHSYEIESPTFSANDPDFRRYVKRNFDAEWVDSEDPLERVINLLGEVNARFGDLSLFRRTSNPYLAYPVGNTHKALCDSCSELSKLIGPDSLNSKAIKTLLESKFSFGPEHFRHSESGRDLSALELLSQLGEKIQAAKQLETAIKRIYDLRIEADHKVTDPLGPSDNHLRRFRELCEDLASALEAFVDVLSALA